MLEVVEGSKETYVVSLEEIDNLKVLVQKITVHQ